MRLDLLYVYNKTAITTGYMLKGNKTYFKINKKLL